VAGINNLLGLGRDALQAQAYGLNIAGQNITNANTPGYVRRTADLETRVAGTITYGGVYAAGLQRHVDQFLDAKTYDATGFDAQAKSRDSALARIENIFNDSAGTGLSSSLAAMFSALGALGATPSDTTARTTVLESARVVAQRVRESSQQISSVRRDLLDQAQGVAEQVNQLASQLVDLNRQVANVQATGGDAADLCDQRDRVVSKMAEHVNVHVFTDGSGKFVVSAGGATLVEGNESAKLSVTLSPTDGTLQIVMDRPGGSAMDVTSQISGGTLGGIREARDVDASEVAQRLDQFAYDLATAVNAQHAAGYGLDGSTGRNLFQVSGPAGTAPTLALDPRMDGHP
jgi:flagellar hook-associated protein 1